MVSLRCPITLFVFVKNMIVMILRFFFLNELFTNCTGFDCLLFAIGYDMRFVCVDILKSNYEIRTFSRHFQIVNNELWSEYCFIKREIILYYCVNDIFKFVPWTFESLIHEINCYSDYRYVVRSRKIHVDTTFLK